MKPLILVLFASITLGACKKSKDAPAFTKENVAGKYKTTKIAFAYGGAESDVTNDFMEDCAKDDITTLNVDLSYTYVDAGVSCGDDDYDGEWSIISSSKVTKDGEEFEVVKWDGTTLGLATAFNMGTGDGKLITYMTKQ